MAATDLGDFYSVSMIDGRLVFLLGSGSDPAHPLEYTTKERFNDEREHAVNVVRKDRV